LLSTLIEMVLNEKRAYGVIAKKKGFEGGILLISFF
jgi:hypothetical protein